MRIMKKSGKECVREKIHGGICELKTLIRFGHLVRTREESQVERTHRRLNKLERTDQQDQNNSETRQYR